MQHGTKMECSPETWFAAATLRGKTAVKSYNKSVSWWYALNNAEQGEEVIRIVVIMNNKFILDNTGVHMSRWCIPLCPHYSTDEVCHSLSAYKRIIFILVRKHNSNV